MAEELEGLDWPEGTMAMQRAWIGRSEGAEVVFRLRGVGGGEDIGGVTGEEATGAVGGAGGDDGGAGGGGAALIPAGGTSSALAGESAVIPAGGGTEVRVFTTRADTLMGATYVVVAPEHPLAISVAATNPDVANYIAVASAKSDLDRTVAKSKSGVAAGVEVVHPLSGEPLPVWMAEYVIGSYGTGAVMAVPAHDERDFAFAQQNGLPIKQVCWSSFCFSLGAEKCWGGGSFCFSLGDEGWCLLIMNEFCVCAAERAAHQAGACVGGEGGVGWAGEEGLGEMGWLRVGGAFHWFLSREAEGTGRESPHILTHFQERRHRRCCRHDSPQPLPPLPL